MSIKNPRCSWPFWVSLFALSLAACSSFDTHSRFPQVKGPAQNYLQVCEKLRGTIREYLQDEDRWIPRGRDTSFWQSATTLEISARNLSVGLTNARLTPEELGELLDTTTHRLHDLEYWAATVKTNSTVQSDLTEARSRLTDVRRSANTLPSAKTPHHAAAAKAPYRTNTLFATAEPFSPNDLNGAVQLGKDYLQKKYGIKREAFGNMRVRELANRHEVILETHTTRYILLVDIRKGTVVSEKSAPKPAHSLAASR